MNYTWSQSNYRYLIIMVMQSIYNKLKGYLKKEDLSIRFVRYADHSFLHRQLHQPKSSDTDDYTRKIEKLADKTYKLGQMPLWAGYNHDNNQTRTPVKVSTKRETGILYKSIVEKFRPQTIVEFGTAFGVSGMYWLAGLEKNGKGELLTFEPNEAWAKVANENLSGIGNRYVLTVGTFEENIAKLTSNNNRKIDIAFIDAIHTRAFVIPQLEIVLKYVSPHALIFLDDINFSEEMREVWNELSQDTRFVASASIGDRVGVLEYKK
jgi:predicted O-methyltransferase YrrM